MRVVVVLIGLLVVCSAMAVTEGFNITKILATHPEFSTFNHYLTVTHLAGEINRRNTITVLAVDNSGMAEVLAKHLSIFSLKNLLYLHVLADYFGARKLHQITHRSAVVSTLFQATGAAPGTTGFVNITNLRGGRVGFGAAAEESNQATLDSFFVKTVEDVSYKIAVVQITKMLRSPIAEAPTPAPNQYNLTLLMAKKGCTVFANLLASIPEVETAYEESVNGGLTIFCPIDQAVKAFAAKYKNLTAEGKTSLLLFHASPFYMSLQMLKTQNGVMTTLATDSYKNYNMTAQNEGEVVTLETKTSTSKISGTVIDEQPLAIYTIDKVLRPWELFKIADELAPAPAPAKSKKKRSTTPVPAGPEGEPDDQTAADDNAGERPTGGRWLAAGAALAAGILVF